MPIENVTVLGGGSFGTSIANILADNGHNVTLWMRDAELVANIAEHHENSRYLPGKPLNPSIKPTTDLQQAVTSAGILFVAIPSKAFRSVVLQAREWLTPDQVLVSTTKGIEADGFLLMSQILEADTNCPLIGVLSGPNLAKEIAAKQITATVIASEDRALNETVQGLLHCGTFRVYASSDVFGVELGGALKNVYAIMAGMAAAMGMGQNTISMLMTRSLAEMSRFAVQKGADPMTFLGLSGVGDLIATCMSPLSRNYRVGFELGKGRELDAIVEELGQVAEGVNTLKLLKQQAEQLGIYMPLVSGLYDIIYNRKTVGQVVGSLMFAEQSRDVEFTLH